MIVVLDVSNLAGSKYTQRQFELSDWILINVEFVRVENYTEASGTNFQFRYVDFSSYSVNWKSVRC